MPLTYAGIRGRYASSRYHCRSRMYAWVCLGEYLGKYLLKYVSKYIVDNGIQSHAVGINSLLPLKSSNPAVGRPDRHGELPSHN